MVNISEYGTVMLDGIDECGFRKINGLLDSGVIVIVPPVGAVETIIAKTFPMEYLEKPVKAQELRSNVEGATITNISKDFPLVLIKSGTAKELRSEWT